MTAADAHGATPTDPIVSDIEQIEAAYRRKVLLQDVAHESGMKLLRIRIREGVRFTILDIDAATARRWGERMLSWAEENADVSRVDPSDSGEASS